MRLGFAYKWEIKYTLKSSWRISHEAALQFEVIDAVPLLCFLWSPIDKNDKLRSGQQEQIRILSRNSYYHQVSFVVKPGRSSANFQWQIQSRFYSSWTTFFLTFSLDYCHDSARSYLTQGNTTIDDVTFVRLLWIIYGRRSFSLLTNHRPVELRSRSTRDYLPQKHSKILFILAWPPRSSRPTVLRFW